MAVAEAVEQGKRGTWRWGHERMRRERKKEEEEEQVIMCCSRTTRNRDWGLGLGLYDEKEQKDWDS